MVIYVGTDWKEGQMNALFKTGESKAGGGGRGGKEGGLSRK